MLLVPGCGCKFQFDQGDSRDLVGTGPWQIFQDDAGALLHEIDLPAADMKPRALEAGLEASEADLNLYPGRSWSGLLDGSAETICAGVVIENDDTPSGYNVRALVTPTHRLTIYPGTEDGELFDLGNDPDERFNLWYDPAHAVLKANLIHQLLDEYSRQTPFRPVSWSSA